MSVEQTVTPKQTFEQQLTNAAVQGVKLAKLMLLRSAVMIAKDVADNYDLNSLIPSPRTPENARIKEEPSPEEEVEVRKRIVIDCCERAFDLALSSELNSDKVYMKSSSDKLQPSSYLAIESAETGSLYLHRPAATYENISRYPFWLHEEVVGNDIELGLPEIYYREIGIDSLGNIEAVEFLPNERVVTRALQPKEALPYYRALSLIRIASIVPHNPVPVIPSS